MDSLIPIILKVFQVLFDNVLAKPEFFIGILVFLGYLLLGRTIQDAFTGFVKAAVGYMLLAVGAAGMVGAFTPILNGLMQKYQLKAAVIDSNFGFIAATKALEGIGISATWTMVALLSGFSFNILLVILKRYTKVRTLFITGHIMVKQATVLTWMLFFAIPELRNVFGAVVVGILIGTYWAVFSNLTVEATERLTGERSFAVGHQQMFGIWLVDRYAERIGNQDNKVEDLKLPGILSIMTDNIMGTSILFLVMFGSLLVALGPEVMAKLDPANYKGVEFITYVISKSLSFTVYFIMLQTGVKMFVAELIESFVGISDKLLKGAIPAVDCVATFGFTHPNTILVGFLCGAIGQVTAILGLLVFNSPIMIISGFVPVFFDNATLAIFANKRGGVRATVLMTMASGVTQVLGGAIAVAMFQLYKYGGWAGNLDWDTVWVGFGFLIKNMGIIGVVLSIVIMLIIPQLQYRRNKERYFET